MQQLREHFCQERKPEETHSAVSHLVVHLIYIIIKFSPDYHDMLELAGLCLCMFVGHSRPAKRQVLAEQELLPRTGSVAKTIVVNIVLLFS